MNDDGPAAESYNHWTVVNLVFTHLADQGLHPTLGEAGDPGAPAADLLRAFGITPSVHGDARARQGVHEELDELRARVLGEPPPGVSD